MQDLAGPAPQILTNMVAATAAGLDGDFSRAARELAPQALKNAAQMADTRAKYGKFAFMDPSKNMIAEASNMEAIVAAIGFKPLRVRHVNTARKLESKTQELRRNQRDKLYDGAAQRLLKDDPSELMRVVEERLQTEPGLNPRDVVNAVLDRAINMSTPKDLMAARGASSGVIQAVGAMPLDRQSEVQRLEMKEAALAKLGYPFGIRPAGRQVRLRAALIDDVVRNDPSLTRDEAALMVDRRMGRRRQYHASVQTWDDEGDM
jgi:hypothetical protein